MKRRRAKQHDAAVRRLGEQPANKMDDEAIDAMYGLEPVYEPSDTSVGETEPTEFVSVSCPYCGETYETRVDLTGGSFKYIEDCQICCQPIELEVAVSEAGELCSVSAHRLD